MHEERRSNEVPILKRIGNYDLTRVLGRGGMGEVWLAEQRQAGGFVRKVAIKLLPTRGRDSDLLRRLVREAQILGTMAHPNIVSLYEFDKDEKTNTAYLAFEYVPGMDLSRIINLSKLSARTMDLGTACYLARECLAGLGYAHGLTDESGSPLEIVHRDISPSNVLCSVTGQVKITDFGIAKWRAASGATTEEFILGKVPYMSPEQVDGLPLDRRTDLWSFGVVLYELLTGKLPFSGRTPVEKMAQILGADIPSLKQSRPDAPQWLDELTGRLLTRDRDERIQDAREALGILVSHQEIVGENPAENLADFLEILQREAAAAPTQNIANPGGRRGNRSQPVSYPVAGARRHSRPTGIPEEKTKDTEGTADASQPMAVPASPPFDRSGDLSAPKDAKDVDCTSDLQNQHAKSPPAPALDSMQGDVATMAARPPAENRPFHAHEATPSRPMESGEGVTAPRWATSDRLGTEVSVDREDMGPLGTGMSAPAGPSGDAGPRDSGPVIRGGILDIDEPLVESMGILRQVVLSMEGLTGPREECWLRSLPNSLPEDGDGLEQFKSALHDAWHVANRPGSRLARCLATTGGILYPKYAKDDIFVGQSGNGPRAYHIITEPGAVPLQRFLDDVLGSELSVAVATVSPILDFEQARGLTSWLQHAWRVALAIDLVAQLAWALSELHAAGSFHGALTPFSILVLAKKRPVPPNEVRAACWKTRSCPCLSVSGTPRLIDVGLGPSLHMDFQKNIERFGLSMERGRLSGDLSRLTPEQVEAALQSAANPLYLYCAPETLREQGTFGETDDVAFCGIVLYELLTGRYPFQAKSAYATLSQALDETMEAAPASRWNPLVGKFLDHVTAKAVSRDPDRRYHNAAELALDLEDLRYEAEHVLATR